MDKYLKMADIFIVGAVTSEHVISLCDDCLAGHWSSEIPNQYAAHAINSHDELVRNMQHYKKEAERWEAIAVKEASMVQEFDLEVERLRGELKSVTNQLMEADAMVQEMQEIIDDK